jgi:hypothetical protein
VIIYIQSLNKEYVVTKKKIFNKWLPANELGIKEGYLEGARFTGAGGYLDAVIYANGQAAIVGYMSCGSKESAEKCAKEAVSYNGNSAYSVRLDCDRTIKFHELFGE